jgi:hypothetical protein
MRFIINDLEDMHVNTVAKNLCFGYILISKEESL